MMLETLVEFVHRSAITSLAFSDLIYEGNPRGFILPYRCTDARGDTVQQPP